MAWTEGVAAFSEFELRLVRGDTKQHHTIATFGAGEFQATFADGFDLNKAIRTRAGPYSVLGCRQDKLYILSTHTGKVDLSETDATNCIALELLDIRNVPQDVQLKGYGRYSPFASPVKNYISPNDVIGVDIEKRNIINSKIGTAATINMLGDSRYVLNDDDSATAALSTTAPLAVFTPAHSDVFVILPTAMFNVDVDTFGS